MGDVSKEAFPIYFALRRGMEPDAGRILDDEIPDAMETGRLLCADGEYEHRRWLRNLYGRMWRAREVALAQEHRKRNPNIVAAAKKVWESKRSKADRELLAVLNKTGNQITLSELKRRLANVRRNEARAA